jgi:hypothetical protein
METYSIDVQADATNPFGLSSQQTQSDWILQYGTPQAGLTNLVLLDFIDGPSLLILLVQEDGLEDMVLNGLLGILELILEI